MQVHHRLSSEAVANTVSRIPVFPPPKPLHHLTSDDESILESGRVLSLNKTLSASDVPKDTRRDTRETDYLRLVGGIPYDSGELAHVVDQAVGKEKTKSADDTMESEDQDGEQEEKERFCFCKRSVSCRSGSSSPLGPSGRISQFILPATYSFWMYAFTECGTSTTSGCGQRKGARMGWPTPVPFVLDHMEYDLVLLYPSRTLPTGTVMAIKKSPETLPKLYAIGSDGDLHEGPAGDGPRLQPFRHWTRRQHHDKPNHFLVALNAGSKIDSHLRCHSLNKFSTHSQNLIALNQKLVQLILTLPTPPPDTTPPTPSTSVFPTDVDSTPKTTKSKLVLQPKSAVNAASTQAAKRGGANLGLGFPVAFEQRAQNMYTPSFSNVVLDPSVEIETRLRILYHHAFKPANEED